MHSRGTNVESILNKAGEHERNYDWKGAKQLYETILSSTSQKKDLTQSAAIAEKIAFCQEKAALQAKNPEEFRQLAEDAVRFYEKAAGLYVKSKSAQGQTKSLDQKAKAEYINSWLATDLSEKKTQLDNCLKLHERALNYYKEARDTQQYIKTSNQLLQCFLDRSYIAADWQDLNKTLNEATTIGENAIIACTETNNDEGLSRAYSLTSLHYFRAAQISQQEDKTKEYGTKSLGYAQKAQESSRRTNDRQLVALVDWALTVATLFFSDDVSKSLTYAEQMLNHGTATGDSYIAGVAFYQQAFISYWIVPTEEDPDKIRKTYESIMKQSEVAIQHLSAISHDYFLATAYYPYIESYYSLACEVETDNEKKRALLEDGVKAGRRGLEHARQSGSPDPIGSNLHALSKVLYSLARMEAKPAQKKELLKEALRHRKEHVTVVQKAFPTSHWVRGVGKNYEALIRAELADVETDKEVKISHLRDAASNMEECLEQCNKWTAIYPQNRLFAVLGEYYSRFGDILTQSYSLTEDATTLGRSVEAYESAAALYRKTDLASRVAEAYWRIGTLSDKIRDHVKASKNFESASSQYESAATNIPLLKEFYSDYANYMHAWSEIENAKLRHSQEKYSNSMTHYEKAAGYLNLSKAWKYLAPNFSAWAFLENAEDLSRREKGQEALEAFGQASDLFANAKSSLEHESKRMQRIDEKEEANELTRACDRRKEYCIARVSLEEAKIYEKEGENLLSGERYASAAKMFERLVESLETELDRREIMPMVYMCQAWQKMVLGEERVDASSYAEASELFLKAKECCLNDRTALLALGNHAYCKALESGTMFESTRDGAYFSKAKQYLDSASNYYLRAGHENSAVWINATQVLFDAYVYMNQAEVEVDPQKKHERYLLAEKCLERAALLYEKAGFTGKENETRKSLEKVKEKREFVSSLGEILKVPSITLSTAGVFAPTLSHEDPVGLQRFEHADVQANLAAQPREVTVGQRVDLDLDLANAGKGSALLIGIEDFVPKGFEIAQKPENYRIEGGRLNMKGKKLGALKTEEVRFALEARTKGTFHIRPRILFQDETGEHRSYEPEPLTITVKELGIWRWIRGPSK